MLLTLLRGAAAMTRSTMVEAGPGGPGSLRDQRSSVAPPHRGPPGRRIRADLPPRVEDRARHGVRQPFGAIDPGRRSDPEHAPEQAGAGRRGVRRKRIGPVSDDMVRALPDTRRRARSRSPLRASLRAMGRDRIAPRPWGRGEFTEQETGGLRGSPPRPAGPGPGRPRSCGARGEPRTRPSLLVDRPGHPRAAGRTRVGGEGHRPARRRSPEGVLREQGLLQPQPPVHEELRRGVAGPGYRARAPCTDHVVAQPGLAREGQGPGAEALVRPQDGRARLEPERARDPHRARALRRPGRGEHELLYHAPGSAVGPCPGDPEGPLRARLPRPHRRRRGARDRTRARSAHPRLPARARPRVRVRRKPGPAPRGGRGIPDRPPPLSPEAPLLRRHRAEGRAVPA